MKNQIQGSAVEASPISRFISWLSRRFSGAYVSRGKVDTQHGYFSILLPSDHMLPTYHRKHLKYDRFLPHLVKHLSKDSIVVDVGANCGDTLASMIEVNQFSTYICIEPDEVFFSYLNSNIVKIKESIPDARIYTVKSMVGQNISNASLEGKNGSKHAVISENNEGLISKSLDLILSEFDTANICLVKSDVDGFDYDVIDSGRTLFATRHPVLFFECQYDFDYQKKGFEASINWLKSIGYSDWTMFDNFGAVVLRTKNVEHVFQLLQYVWAQNQKQSTRTIFYFDILVASDSDVAFVDTVLSSY